MKSIIVLVFLLFSVFSYAWTQPDAELTPGVLCTEEDPDFSELDYDEEIPRCERNVSTAEKQKVAKSYGNIPKDQWADYEFDHFIPLCVGGSNNIKNIWPQPIDEAKEKDVIEDQVCRGLQKGTMTQAEAVKKIHNWFNQSLTQP